MVGVSYVIRGVSTVLGSVSRSCHQFGRSEWKFDLHLTNSVACAMFWTMWLLYFAMCKHETHTVFDLLMAILSVFHSTLTHNFPILALFPLLLLVFSNSTILH